MKITSVSATWGRTIQPRQYHSANAGYTLIAEVQSGETLEDVMAALTFAIQAKVSAELSLLVEAYKAKEHGTQ